jgi:heptosyltransferase-2
MTVQLMRFVDRFVGVPLCLFFGLWKKIFCSHRTQLPDEKIQNILVIKFFGMGSIVLLTPTLREIKKKYPNASLTFLSFKSNLELLKRISSIDSILSISTETLDDFIRTTLSLRKIFREKHFDIVFDFEFFSKFSTLLSALTNAPQRIAFALPTRWRKLLVTKQITLNKSKHVTQVFLSQTESQLENIILEQPKIFESDIATFYYKCKAIWEIVLQEKQFVTVNINTGTTFLERRWRKENFIQLAKEYFSNDYFYFFIGNEEEFPYVENVVREINKPNVINAAGQLTFGELLVLLSHSSLLLSNDSGPLHLAAALGKRTLSLFGPESPEFYGPIGNNHTVIYKKISCSPCMNVYDAKSFRCPYDAQCMKEISVEEVKSEINKILNFV